MPTKKKRSKKPIKRMRPVRWCRISQAFAAPGSYASSADSHGPAGHHTGIDFGSHLVPFKAIENQPVRSTTPGTVVINSYNSTMGNWVGVYYAKDNVTITYWHMNKRLAPAVGTWIERGTVVGLVGNTGNSFGAHLHVQINRGRGFYYSGHIKPWGWVHGQRWWRLFDRKRKADRKHQKARGLYANSTLSMAQVPEIVSKDSEAPLHPSVYDGEGSAVQSFASAQDA